MGTYVVHISAGSGTRLPENLTRPATILGYPQYPNPDIFGLSITRPDPQINYPRVPEVRTNLKFLNIFSPKWYTFDIFQLFFIKKLVFGQSYSIYKTTKVCIVWSFFSEPAPPILMKLVIHFNVLLKMLQNSWFHKIFSLVGVNFFKIASKLYCDNTWGYYLLEITVCSNWSRCVND